MEIFLVYLDVDNTQPIGYQVGLGYISAIAKEKGYAVRYFSPQNELAIKRLIKESKKYKPDVIAFSCVSTQFKYAKQIAQEVKKHFNPKIICGGLHPTISPECLNESEFIEAIIRGEGEYPFLEFLELVKNKKDYSRVQNLWTKKDGCIVKNKIRPLIKDLDILPFPDRESLDFQRTIDKLGFCSFMFSRGCPFDCYYCCNSILNTIYESSYVRFRSVDKSLEEIELTLGKFKIKKLSFLNFDDDNFNVNRDWFFDFIKKYKKRIGKAFMCNLKVGFCSLEMFKLLKEANCIRVRIGVENGDENFRRKFLNRHMSNKEIVETFAMAHKVGLKTYSFNVIGFPYETPEICQRTIDLNARLHPNLPFAGIFYPYPKTHLRELCEKEGFLIVQRLEDISIRERDEVVLNSPCFSKDEVLYYYKNFNYLVLKKVCLCKAILYRINRIYILFISFIRKIVKIILFRKIRII